jgi:hypothetical protein
MRMGTEFLLLAEAADAVGQGTRRVVSFMLLYNVKVFSIRHNQIRIRRAGIAQSVWLLVTGWTIGFRGGSIPGRG